MELIENQKIILVNLIMNKIKRNLYLVITLTLLSSFLFTNDLWIFAIDLGKSTDIAYIIAAQAGIFGGIMMWFQYILGIRGITRLFSQDLLSFLAVHKNIGIFGLLVVFLHPSLMNIFYMSNEINLLIPKFDTEFDIAVRIGSTAYFFFLVIYFSSALLRKRLGFRAWKILHFISFLIFPLVFIHALEIGTVVNFTNFKYFWYFFGITFLLAFIYRILFQFGFGKSKYRISSITEEAKGTIKLKMKAEESQIKEITPGQFLYLTKKGFLKESHPFTVSGFDNDNKELIFNIKKEGKWTKRLKDLKEGDEIYVDGPYGIFLKDVSDFKNLVFYAGGIGITPFLSTIEKYINTEKKITLFISARDPKEIVDKDKLEKLSIENNNFEIIYIITGKSGLKTEFKTYNGQRIDINLIEECLSSDLRECFHGICGPKPFIKSIEKILLNEGVLNKQIDKELFSY